MNENTFITLFNNLHFHNNKRLLIEKYCLDHNKSMSDTLIFITILDQHLRVGKDLFPYLLDYAIRFYVEKFNLIIITYNNNKIIKKYNG